MAKDGENDNRAWFEAFVDEMKTESVDTGDGAVSARTFLKGKLRVSVYRLLDSSQSFQSFLPLRLSARVDKLSLPYKKLVELRDEAGSAYFQVRARTFLSPRFTHLSCLY